MGHEDDPEPEIWPFPVRVTWINNSWIVISTILVIVKLYHSYTRPPTFAMRNLNIVGNIVLFTSWTYFIHLHVVTSSWYYGDYLGFCNLVTKFVGAHLALVHSALCVFYAQRLDIVAGPATFWWKKERKRYNRVKYGVISFGFITPTLWLILVKGSLQPSEDEGKVFCAIETDTTAKILLPTVMMCQLGIYLLVFFLFIRPVRQLCEVVESTSLRHLFYNTSYWNSTMIIVEGGLILVIFLIGGLMDESDWKRSEFLGHTGNVDVCVVSFCVVMCLRGPLKEKDIIHKETLVFSSPDPGKKSLTLGNERIMSYGGDTPDVQASNNLDNPRVYASDRKSKKLAGLRNAMMDQLRLFSRGAWGGPETKPGGPETKRHAASDPEIKQSTSITSSSRPFELFTHARREGSAYHDGESSAATTWTADPYQDVRENLDKMMSNFPPAARTFPDQ